MKYTVHFTEDDLDLPLDSVMLTKELENVNKTNKLWYIAKERRCKLHKPFWKVWTPNHRWCYRLYRKIPNRPPIVSLCSRRIKSYEYEAILLDYGKSQMSSSRVIKAYLTGIRDCARFGEYNV